MGETDLVGVRSAGICFLKFAGGCGLLVCLSFGFRLFVLFLFVCVFVFVVFALFFENLCLSLVGCRGGFLLCGHDRPRSDRWMLRPGLGLDSGARPAPAKGWAVWERFSLPLYRQPWRWREQCWKRLSQCLPWSSPRRF